ncbi:hypothetical protein [Methanococcus maripaludis]|uniref:Uncharacterized protein n=1 Tax=Methanococcus maripaludis TaxID=39152 RepID=A0A7J9PNP2_METMI|nr:hypothetical protein [Methanococcus maripaludis]MBA2864428.1 hypothetical protein [Methanococcus maripaludis]
MPSSIISNGEHHYDSDGNKYKINGNTATRVSDGATFDTADVDASGSSGKSIAQINIERVNANKSQQVQRVETVQNQENSTGNDRVETVQQNQDLYFKNVEDQLAYKRGESLLYDVYENPNNSGGWKNPTVSAKSTTFTNWYRANDVKRSYGKSGEVIISDVKTGEILGIYEKGAVTENYGSILIDETRPYQQEGSIKYRNALGEDVTIKVEKSHDKYFRNVEDQLAYKRGESLPYDVGTNPNDNGGWNNNPNPNVKTSYISYKMEKKPYVLGNESLGMKTSPSMIAEMYKNMNQGSVSQKRDIPGEALKASFIQLGDIQEKRMNWYMTTGENQFKRVPYIGGYLGKWAGRTGGAAIGTIVNAPYGMAQGVTAFVAIAREKKLKEAYSFGTVKNFTQDSWSGLKELYHTDKPQFAGMAVGMWAMGKVAGKASGTKVSKNSITVTKQPSIFSISKNTKGTTVRWGAEGATKEIVESFQKKGMQFEVKKVYGYEKNIDKILPQKNIKKVSYKVQNGNEGILLKAFKNKIQRTHMKDSGNTKVIENYVVNKNKGTDYSFKKTILDNGKLNSVNKGFKSNEIVSIDRARSGKITNSKTPNHIEVSSDFVNFVKNNRLLNGMSKQEQLNIYEVIRSKKGITASGKEFNSITKSYAKTLNEGKVKESAYIKFGRGTPEAPAAITSDVAQVNRLTASLGRSGGVKLVKGRIPAKRTPMSRTFNPKPNPTVNRLVEKLGNNRGTPSQNRLIKGSSVRNIKPTGNRLISRNPPKNIPKTAVSEIVHVKSVPKMIGNFKNIRPSGASAIAKASVLPGFAFKMGSRSGQGQGQSNSQKPKSNQKTQQKIFNQNIVSNIGGNRQAQGIFQNQKQKPSQRTRVIPVTGIKFPDPKVPVSIPFGIGGFKGKGIGFSIAPNNRSKNNKNKGIFGAQKSEINLGQLFSFGLKKGGKRGKR